MTFLISGAIGVCSESIAGEKERGTIATLLVTPVKRSNLVIGKIAALGVVSIASAFVSFLGLVLSLPKLVGASFSLATYGLPAMLLLLLVVVVTSLFFTTILTIISTYARSVKEATSLALPLTMIVMVTGITGMASGSGTPESYMYLIPIYNSIQVFNGILNLSFNVWNIVVTIISNLIFVGVGVYLLTKMFDSEKIMFNK
jgi:sodium transport system permease protein